MKRGDIGPKISDLVGRGLQDADIAQRLSISTRTVLRHRTALGLASPRKHPEPTAAQILVGLEKGLSLNNIASFNHLAKTRIEEILREAGHEVPVMDKNDRAKRVRADMLASVREQEDKKGLPRREARA